ncbi:pur operon repressor [Numidum massiliense]|uniref:pur operon repressor n=1 Tax=Numidum massiliense TaxID=1522315 RepID=UPI0006D57589|nr:pur operon repressor [Numidum massiliense]
MKKRKRSARLVGMTRQLLASPRQVISLSRFAEQYGAAKSSLSEDLAIIQEVFQEDGYGELQTIAGAAGGVHYIPTISREAAAATIDAICDQLAQAERILPGGYLYMSDILGQPATVNCLGLMFASHFTQPIDAVLTVATKGIPLAYATAHYLDVPVVIARRDSRVIEGSAVSINYVSGSSKRIQTMSLARRNLPEGSRVLVIDDFMKAGGTVRGIKDLLAEFRAEVVGVGIFVDLLAEERLVDGVVSLATLTEVDPEKHCVTVVRGNYFSE